MSPLSLAASDARARWGRFLAGISVLGAIAACDALGAPSKVRAGELYVSGSAKYDAYFGDVHSQQIAAAGWAGERKRARKGLVDALRLPEEVDDATLVQATKDRMSGGALRLEVKGSEARIVAASAARQDDPHDWIVGVEQAAQAETERAKKLGELPTRLDQLTKEGRALEVHLGEDFGGQGHKPFDVRQELNVSYETLRALAQAAVTERKIADQFVAELGRAVAAGSVVPVSPPPPKDLSVKSRVPARAPKPDESARPARNVRTEPTGPSKSTPALPMAKPAEHTEVFSP